MKKLLLLFAFYISLFTFHLSLLTFYVFAQVHQEWVARYLGPSNDLIGPFLQVDKSGNSYVAGTHVINDSINILCVKYNTSGVQQWATLYKYAGYGYFASTGMAIDSFGNAYIIALYSYNLYTPQSILTVKFNNSDGTVLWARSYTGQYNIGSAPSDIKIDRLNNIYVVGYSDSSHLVIRYNTNGDSVWVRKYHPPPIPPLYPVEDARACTIDDSLNIIFTGRRRDIYPPYGYYDSLLVAKYSSGGVLRWESTYSSGLTNPNVGTKIAADQNGSLYIGGATAISDGAAYLTLKYDRNGTRQWTAIYDPTGSAGNTIYGIAMDRMNNALFVTGYSIVNSIGSAATIKYITSTGDSAWVRRGFGVPGSSSAWDVEVDSSGNAYITGSSQGISSSDVSTLKYSPQGNPVWFITYNGPYNGGDGAQALGLDNQNNVYVLGYSQSGFQMSDYVVIKYSQLVGIKKISNQFPYKFNLSSYPNPFNPQTSINFSIPYKSQVKIIMYDILGREIHTIIDEKDIKPGEYKVNWDASSFSSGVYFCEINAFYKNENNIQNYINTIKLVLLK